MSKCDSSLNCLRRQRVIYKPKRSILELSDLGKEIWDGIDAEEYVNQERDSWNG